MYIGMYVCGKYGSVLGYVHVAKSSAYLLVIYAVTVNNLLSKDTGHRLDNIAADEQPIRNTTKQLQHHTYYVRGVHCNVGTGTTHSERFGTALVDSQGPM